ncbi:MAG: hypothetical protein UEW60_03755 [Christensenellales bacterium]|jgi:hypothetical protein|nr:hypothetical protein [Christensenellales bacterium]
MKHAIVAYGFYGVKKISRSREEIKKKFTTVAAYAENYGISRSRAFELMTLCPRYEVTEEETGKKRIMIRRTDADCAVNQRGSRGNPRFKESEFQRKMIHRRWYGKKK